MRSSSSNNTAYKQSSTQAEEKFINVKTFHNHYFLCHLNLSDEANKVLPMIFYTGRLTIFLRPPFELGIDWESQWSTTLNDSPGLTLISITQSVFISTAITIFTASFQSNLILSFCTVS